MSRRFRAASLRARGPARPGGLLECAAQGGRAGRTRGHAGRDPALGTGPAACATPRSSPVMTSTATPTGTGSTRTRSRPTAPAGAPSTSSTSARSSRCSSIVQALPADAPEGSNAQKVGDYYRAFIDTAAIEQKRARAGARRARRDRRRQEPPRPHAPHGAGGPGAEGAAAARRSRSTRRTPTATWWCSRRADSGCPTATTT